MTNSHYFDSVSVTEAFKKGKFDTKKFSKKVALILNCHF